MKTLKELAVPVIVLTVICAVVTGALALTYQFTAPYIAKAAASAADGARIELLPEADSFTQLTDEVVTGIEGLVDAYQADNGAGFVFTSKAKGYGGDVFVMTGISSEGQITNVKLMENSETPGLGTRVGEEAHVSKFIGKDSKLEGTDVVSGATISSTAFKDAILIAFQAYGAAAGVEVEVPEEPVIDPRTVIFPGEELTPIQIEGADEAYQAGSSGIIVVVKVEGYHPGMEVITGIGADGKIAGVGMGANEETKGLGTKVGEAEHTAKFVGLEADAVDSVAAVTNATISSDGFKRGVKKAFELVTQEMLDAIATAKYTQVLPGATTFEPFEAENAIEAVRAENGIVVVTQAEGYGGAITAVVGIDNNGVITGVNFLSNHSETQGLGTKALDKEHTSQFVGKDTADGVAAVSNATVTSDAVKKAIAKALAIYEATKGA